MPLFGRAEVTGGVCCSSLIGMRLEVLVPMRRMHEGAHAIAGEHKNQERMWCVDRGQPWALVAMPPSTWHVLRVHVWSSAWYFLLQAAGNVPTCLLVWPLRA